MNKEEHKFIWEMAQYAKSHGGTLKGRKFLGRTHSYKWRCSEMHTCFVSFLGSDGFCVFPSYPIISKRCGLSPNTIRKALDVLEEYEEFNKKFKRDIFERTGMLCS